MIESRLAAKDQGPNPFCRSHSVDESSLDVFPIHITIGTYEPE